MTFFCQAKELLKKLIPNWLVICYHFLLAFLGALVYGFASRKLTVIGVTGTKGKSTTVNLIAKILEEKGNKVALSSSIIFKIAEKQWQNKLKMGMPGRFFLQWLLKKAVRAGCKYAVIEVTSEGILQHRHRFINFDIAVFTNLSPEHIENHGSFENYRLAKLELFKRTKGAHVINLDDENTKYFLDVFAEEKIGYTLKSGKPKCQMSNVPEGEQAPYGAGKSNPNVKCQIIEAQNFQILPQGLKFYINQAEFNLKLLGKFNVYNALAAVCVGVSQGIDLATCCRALEKVKKMPGRMEVVIKKPFKVIVDYAHTPDSLEKVYQSLKPENNPLICVLGSCGGGRDKKKRPIMGKIAGQYCDKVIITNEDPYNEKPIEIIEQVASGCPGKAEKILNRKQAIRKALSGAKPGDIVIITGKGSEPWLCLENGKKIPWDDREIVRQEFKNLAYKK